MRVVPWCPGATPLTAGGADRARCPGVCTAPRAGGVFRRALWSARGVHPRGTCSRRSLTAARCAARCEGTCHGRTHHAWVAGWPMTDRPTQQGMPWRRRGVGHGPGRLWWPARVLPRFPRMAMAAGSPGRRGLDEGVPSGTGSVLVLLARAWGWGQRVPGGLHVSLAGWRHGEVWSHARPGSPAGGGGSPRRSTIPSRPLTTHWSRRQQPPLVPRCGSWRGSPRAFGCCPA